MEYNEEDECTICFVRRKDVTSILVMCVTRTVIIDYSTGGLPLSATSVTKCIIHLVIIEITNIHTAPTSLNVINAN